MILMLTEEAITSDVLLKAIGNRKGDSVNTVPSPAYRVLNATDRDAIISIYTYFPSVPALKIVSTTRHSDREYLADRARWQIKNVKVQPYQPCWRGAHKSIFVSFGDWLLLKTSDTLPSTSLYQVATVNFF